MSQRLRPASVRHAFALAFDLAIRRDAFHSLVVPLLLRAPWIVATALLPPYQEAEHPARVVFITSCAVLGDWLVFLVTTAMLRIRARSVFNTPPEVAPMPILDCYAQGLGRVGWLLVTETLRNLAVTFAMLFFVVPGLWLGFRLSFATEAVVLGDRNAAAAFRHSFHVTPGRFERWLEMIVASGALVLVLWFTGAALSISFSNVPISTWVTVVWLAITAVTPIIQYAWTFFYLRLVEVEDAGIEVGPAYAARPQVVVGGEAPLADAEPSLRANPPLALVESRPGEAERRS